MNTSIIWMPLSNRCCLYLTWPFALPSMSFANVFLVMTLLLDLGTVWIMKGGFISRSLLYSYLKRFLSKLGYIKGHGYWYLIRGATIQVTAWPHTSAAVSLSWPGHIPTCILKWMLVCCRIPLYIVLQAQLELKYHKNAEWSLWEKWPLWVWRSDEHWVLR